MKTGALLFLLTIILFMLLISFVELIQKEQARQQEEELFIQIIHDTFLHEQKK